VDPGAKLRRAAGLGKTEVRGRWGFAAHGALMQTATLAAWPFHSVERAL